jgi:integrase
MFPGDRCWREPLVPYVFHHNRKLIRDFRHAWRVACRRAGLIGKIPHDFRRTAVRNLERAGVSRSVAMQLVGHETEAIYQRYAITTEKDLAEGVAKLATLNAQDGDARVTPLSAAIG